MSDPAITPLVKRLRDCAAWDPALLREAADEIERLGTDLAVATKTLSAVLDIEELNWGITYQGQLKIYVEGMKNYVGSGADEPTLRRLLDASDDAEPVANPALAAAAARHDEVVQSVHSGQEIMPPEPRGDGRTLPFCSEHDSPFVAPEGCVHRSSESTCRAAGGAS